MNVRKQRVVGISVWILAMGTPFAWGGGHEAAIKEAESAGPELLTANATIKSADGTVLREGSNGYTCYPQRGNMAPMCNPPAWDELMNALMAQKPYSPDQISVSYMLAGDEGTPGVSNSDPYATDPSKSKDWVIEGPHLMIAVPDPAMLEGMSTDPADPVYVMWKDTPYAHLMVKIASEK